MDTEDRLQVRAACQSELEVVQEQVGDELSPDDARHLALLIERISDDAPNYQLLEDVVGRFGDVLVKEYGYTPGSDPIVAFGEVQVRLKELREQEQ